MHALIEVVTEIEAGSEVVFGLELDMDVHAASLATSGETATTSTGRRRVELGDEVTFRARHFGRVWHMTSRITWLGRGCSCSMTSSMWISGPAWLCRLG
ncbi:hypothetical protein [Dactylosporangium sp. NPDC050588]|uniref:hypothetical protein n=1 Tax=Dactylosporangium sp. NPDC050588 TaxID=3157211 RepID=UPI0033D03B67